MGRRPPFGLARWSRRRKAAAHRIRQRAQPRSPERWRKLRILSGIGQLRSRCRRQNASRATPLVSTTTPSGLALCPLLWAQLHNSPLNRCATLPACVGCAWNRSFAVEVQSIRCSKVAAYRSRHVRPLAPPLQRAGGIGGALVARRCQGNVGAGLVSARVPNPTGCRTAGQSPHQLWARRARSDHARRIAPRAATGATPTYPEFTVVPTAASVPRTGQVPRNVGVLETGAKRVRNAGTTGGRNASVCAGTGGAMCCRGGLVPARAPKKPRPHKSHHGWPQGLPLPLGVAFRRLAVGVLGSAEAKPQG